MANYTRYTKDIQGPRYAPCPYCGTPMNPQEYDVTETVAKGWMTSCPKPECGSTGPKAGPGNIGRDQAIAASEQRIPWPPRK